MGGWRGQRGAVLEALWREEVEEVEELLQVVLQRGARQQQLVLDLVAVQHPKELGGGGVRGRTTAPRPPPPQVSAPLPMGEPGVLWEGLMGYYGVEPYGVGYDGMGLWGGI